ncbi:MAG: sugar ABC transporter ATP-binding protein [Woeseiaceae bacterium]
MDNAELDLASGKVHALMGANGAGKTTLCNVICGITPADSGTMECLGTTYCPATILDANRAGIRMVMQELNLINDLTVAENLYFGRLPTRYGVVDLKRLNAEAQTLLDTLGIDDLSPTDKVRDLGIGQQQLLEIARALAVPCQLLILDEPTAALSDPQVALLFDNINRIKEAGTAVLYISHRMEEIKQIADEVSVLRDGRTVFSGNAKAVPTETLIRNMAAPISTPIENTQRAVQKTRALRLQGIRTERLLRDVSLDVHYGEILGIAGLMGSGRTELLRAIYGADPISNGVIFGEYDDQPLPIASPVDAVKQDIGLIPEDRKQHGVFLTQSIRQNITLLSLDRFANRWGWIDSEREYDAVQQQVNALSLHCDHIEQVAATLSGGNQQKVSIARWLLLDCRILLFDEPTRGIDIHAKSQIYALLRALAAAGKAVVIVSSENSELTALSDRIAVMSNGHLTAVFEQGTWSSQSITAASFSGFDADPQTAVPI